MKKFSLKRVHDLRIEREERVAAELVKARRDVDRASAAHDAVCDARVTGETQIAAAARAGATIGELHALSSVLTSIDARLDAAKAAVATAHEIAARARELHDEASRDRCALDRLHERHREVVRLEAAAADRVAMDAVALARFNQGHPRSAAGGNR